MAVILAIPAFNEGHTIEAVVRQAARHVGRVVVVDDGSTDLTSARAERAGATVLRHPSNLGKGAAIQTAIRWARSQDEVEALALMDGDGQHDASDLPRLIRALVDLQLDIVVGSRFLGCHNAPLYRLFGLHVLSASAHLGSGVPLTDSQSGYRVLSRRAIDRLALRESGFAVESEMQFEAARLGLRVGEISIEIRYAGTPRRSPVVHGVSVLLATLWMTAVRRPRRLAMLLATPIVALRIARCSPATATGGTLAGGGR